MGDTSDREHGLGSGVSDVLRSARRDVPDRPIREGLNEARCGREPTDIPSAVGAEAGAGEILVSAGTLDGADAEVETGPTRTVRLKGIAEPVALLPVVWT